MKTNYFCLAILAGLFLNLPIESLAFNNEHNGYESAAGVFNVAQKKIRVPRETHSAITPSSPYFIEIAVFVDSTMSMFYKKNLSMHVKMQMAKTSEVFKHLLTERPIDIVVTEITEIDKEFVTTDKNLNIDNIHQNFCKWQHQRRDDSHRYDVGLLLTRKNINDNKEKNSTHSVKSKVLKGTICKSPDACAVIIDGDYGTISTICQVIGRLLNLEYEPRRDKNYQRFSEERHVMNHYQVHAYPLEWSNRSRDEVTKFFDAGNGKCLLDRPEKLIDLSNAPLMGEVYSELSQCQVMGDLNSSLPDRSQYHPRLLDKPLSRCTLWCRLNSSSTATTYNWPVLDGTPCGLGKICYGRKCINIKDRLNGGWGPWKSSSECSRSCDSGYKILTRQCNNPLPQKGGNYCVGNSVQYEICNTQTCPKKSLTSMRQEQCSKFNDAKHQWIANLKESNCRVSCLIEGNANSVIDHGSALDGTPCGHDSSHICINGICKQAGCDNVIDSDAKFDICGVCRGDNTTCQRIAGKVFITKSTNGSKLSLNIPSESFKINVKTSKINVSGEKFIGQKRTGSSQLRNPKVDNEGFIDRYISEPIETDWIIEINSTNMSSLSTLVYDFYMQKKQLDKYQWSNYTVGCQNVMYQNLNCQRTKDGLVVPDGLCNFKQLEQLNKRRNCTELFDESHWKYSEWSNCSASCGNGTRTRNIWCSTGTKDSCNYYQIPDTVEICNSAPCDDNELPKVWNVNESCKIYHNVSEKWRKVSKDWASEIVSLSKNTEINSQFLFAEHTRHSKKIVNDTHEELLQIISKNEKVSKNDFNKECSTYAINNVYDVNRIYRGRVEECDEIKLQTKLAIDEKINSTMAESYVGYLEYFCEDGWTEHVKERIDFAKNFTINYLKQYRKTINTVREKIVEDMLSNIKSRIICYVEIGRILNHSLEDVHNTYKNCLYKKKR